jgi:hypothetical protein
LGNQAVNIACDVPQAKLDKPWMRWWEAQSIGQHGLQKERLEVIVGTLGHVSNGGSVGQMFGTLRDKASAKQATSACAEFTAINLFVPWGAS